jgi:hypothetical protein
MFDNNAEDQNNEDFCFKLQVQEIQQKSVI